MTPLAARRMLRILELRKLKVDEEIARINTGISAGRSLRDKLEEAQPPHQFTALTTKYMTRTVGIIDRGLSVLSEQKQMSIRERARMEAGHTLLEERVNELTEDTELQLDEDALSEWLMIKTTL